MAIGEILDALIIHTARGFQPQHPMWDLKHLCVTHRVTTAVIKSLEEGTGAMWLAFLGNRLDLGCDRSLLAEASLCYCCLRYLLAIRSVPCSRPQSPFHCGNNTPVSARCASSFVFGGSVSLLVARHTSIHYYRPRERIQAILRV